MIEASGANRPPLRGRRILFVVPVTPAFTGNGLAMRAASLLEAMRDEGAFIRLVIIPTHEPYDLKPCPAVVAICGGAWSLVPAPKHTWWSWAEEGWRRGKVNPLWPGPVYARWRRRAERILSESTEDMLVVFRLAMFSFLFPRRIERLPCWLDLDELDSLGLRRQEALAATDGKQDEVRRLDRKASLIATMERGLLAKPKWLSVASEVERGRLPGSIRAHVFILPNAVRSRVCLPLRKIGTSPFRCLFVGSFGHPPNVDAVTWFYRDVLPSLQRACTRPVILVVAGSDLGRDLSFLAGKPGVELLGRVDDLELVYREADVAVVPLRTGVGTRIKILEAFSFGRAVISTPIGAEGLRVTADRELVIAPADGGSFAEACAQLLADPGRQRQLAAAGLAYVQREHSPEAVRQALRGSCKSSENNP